MHSWIENSEKQWTRGWSEPREEMDEYMHLIRLCVYSLVGCEEGRGAWACAEHVGKRESLWET